MRTVHVHDVITNCNDARKRLRRVIYRCYIMLHLIVLDAYTPHVYLSFDIYYVFNDDISRTI